MIPITTFAGWLVFDSANRERDSIEAGLKDTNRALVTALDRDFQSSIAALNVLATSKSLDTADFPEFYELCKRALATQRGWKNVILHEPSGKAILNLAVPFGSPIPAPMDRKTLESVVQAKNPMIVDLIKGSLVGWKFGVRVPVLREGQVKYVLSAFLWSQAGLPQS